MSAGKPESYDEAPQEIRDGVEQLIRTYGSDPALLAGAIVSATTTAILAAKAEEREACVSVVFGAYARTNEKCWKIIRAIRKRGEG